ncbi:MAG: flagellar hook-length control protein FliK [Nitrospira sp.]|nr:flagellar hook-length control protein FliK [Nitrospira sp.]
MDVNSTILQLPSPTAASPSEGAARRSQEVKSPSSGKTKKSFASALRTAQQREDMGRPQQSDEAESRRAAKSDTRSDQGKPVRDDAARSYEIEGRGLNAEGDRAVQNHTTDSGDGESQEGWPAQTTASAAPVEELRLLGQTAPVQSPSEPLTGVPQGTTEVELPASLQRDGVTEASAMPVVLSSVTGESVTALAPTNQAPVVSQGGTESGTKQGQAASATQPMQETPDAPSGQLLDPKAEPAIKAVDHETREQGGTPAQQSQNEKQAAPVQPTAEGGKQASAVSQELSRLDAAGPQLARLVEPPVQQKQTDAAAHPHRDLHAPLPSLHAGDEERGGKPMAIAPHGLQAGADSGPSSDLLWSNQDERQSASDETPWASQAPMAPSQSDLPDDHAAQVMTAGSAASSQPRPVDSRPAPPAGAAASLPPSHDIEPFVPMMNRSVVFEIAEPDLGRINIRVAMANELVHAYLSSDRSEVGQFLINGQDRLQTALQSNGLEMGQFRVDIDRQSAGRSFQQGPPQDQSGTWQQASNRDSRETGFFERHEAAGLSHAGRLNVVA